MRTIYFLPLLIVGCVSSAQTIGVRNKPSNDPDDYIPPYTETMTLLWSDVSSEPKPISEEEERRNYEVSIAKIGQEMAGERATMRDCIVEHPITSRDQYCQVVLNRFCIIDELIDSRGDIHRKDYCPELKGLTRKAK